MTAFQVPFFFPFHPPAFRVERVVSGQNRGKQKGMMELLGLCEAELTWRKDIILELAKVVSGRVIFTGHYGSPARSTACCICAAHTSCVLPNNLEPAPPMHTEIRNRPSTSNPNNAGVHIGLDVTTCHYTCV
jgi:hypothetical protein